MSLSEQAYLGIRRMIVRLDYAPGDVLREQTLQQQVGVGRTPVREALQRLARDQFVTVIPRRGMFVSPVAVDDLALLSETRAVLEPYAARVAARRSSPDDWREMHQILDDTRSVEDDEALLAADRRCHELIWAAAGNRYLTDQLDSLYAHSDRVWHLYLSDVAEMRAAVTEHAAILAALDAGDADRAEQLVRAHVEQFDHHVRTALTRRA